MSEVKDHEARAMATTALIKIEAHEKTCSERWGEARDQLKALFRGHRMIMLLLLCGQGAMVVFLAGLVVTLATGGRP